MKKILLFIGFIFSAMTVVKAQNPSFVPSSFTAEDQVTLTIDVTGTGMAGAAEAYIWIFSNPNGTGGVNGTVNGDWSNSSNAAKMTAAGTNKWSFTFVGTTLFGQAPAQLKSFGFLVKKKDGSAQTPDYKPFNFDPLVFTPSMLRVFPSKVGADDVVTINFDRNYGVSVDEKRMSPTTATITMYDETGAQVGTPLTIPVRSFESTIWAATFIPGSSFTPATGRKLFKFKYRFNGTVLDANGAATPVSSSETEITLTTMQ